MTWRSIEFGTKAEADDKREKHADVLCQDDDCRLKRVLFSSVAPDELLVDGELLTLQRWQDDDDMVTGSGWNYTDPTQLRRGDSHDGSSSAGTPEATESGSNNPSRRTDARPDHALWR